MTLEEKKAMLASYKSPKRTDPDAETMAMFLTTVMAWPLLPLVIPICWARLWNKRQYPECTLVFRITSALMIIPVAAIAVLSVAVFNQP